MENDMDLTRALSPSTSTSSDDQSRKRVRLTANSARAFQQCLHCGSVFHGWMECDKPCWNCGVAHPCTRCPKLNVENGVENSPGSSNLGVQAAPHIRERSVANATAASNANADMKHEMQEAEGIVLAPSNSARLFHYCGAATDRDKPCQYCDVARPCTCCPNLDAEDKVRGGSNLCMQTAAPVLEHAGANAMARASVKRVMGEGIALSRVPHSAHIVRDVNSAMNADIDYGKGMVGICMGLKKANSVAETFGSHLSMPATGNQMTSVADAGSYINPARMAMIATTAEPSPPKLLRCGPKRSGANQLPLGTRKPIGKLPAVAGYYASQPAGAALVPTRRTSTTWPPGTSPAMGLLNASGALVHFGYPVSFGPPTSFGSTVTSGPPAVTNAAPAGPSLPLRNLEHDVVSWQRELVMSSGPSLNQARADQRNGSTAGIGVAGGNKGGQNGKKRNRAVENGASNMEQKYLTWINIQRCIVHAVKATHGGMYNAIQMDSVARALNILRPIILDQEPKYGRFEHDGYGDLITQANPVAARPWGYHDDAERIVIKVENDEDEEG